MTKFNRLGCKFEGAIGMALEPVATVGSLEDCLRSWRKRFPG